jgi:hypothetical protein
MEYTVKAMPIERLRQLVADDYYRGHRHAVVGHVYTGVSTYDQCDAYTLHVMLPSFSSAGANSQTNLILPHYWNTSSVCKRYRFLPSPV